MFSVKTICYVNQTPESNLLLHRTFTKDLFAMHYRIIGFLNYVLFSWIATE